MKQETNTNNISEVQNLLVKQDTSSWIGQGLESIAIAIGILLAVYMVLRVLKDKSIITGHNHNHQVLSIETVKPLSQQTKLMVVKWQGKEYLISESKNGCSVIDNRDVTQDTDKQ